MVDPNPNPNPNPSPSPNPNPNLGESSGGSCQSRSRSYTRAGGSQTRRRLTLITLALTADLSLILIEGGFERYPSSELFQPHHKAFDLAHYHGRRHTCKQQFFTKRKGKVSEDGKDSKEGELRAVRHVPHRTQKRFYEF